MVLSRKRGGGRLGAPTGWAAPPASQRGHGRSSLCRALRYGRLRALRGRRGHPGAPRRLRASEAALRPLTAVNAPHAPPASRVSMAPGRGPPIGGRGARHVRDGACCGCHGVRGARRERSRCCCCCCCCGRGAAAG